MAEGSIKKQSTVNGVIGSGVWNGAYGLKDDTTGIQIMISSASNLLILVDNNNNITYFRLTPYT